MHSTIAQRAAWAGLKIDCPTKTIQPRGLYEEESINPMEMYWDHSCRKKNRKGARRMARAKEIPLCDAMRLFPGKTRT